MPEQRITKILTEEEVTKIINDVKAIQEIECFYMTEKEEIYRNYQRICFFQKNF